MADLRLRRRAHPRLRLLRAPAAVPAGVALPGCALPRVPARGRLRPPLRAEPARPLLRGEHGDGEDHLAEAVPPLHRGLAGRAGRRRLPGADAPAAVPEVGAELAWLRGRDGRPHRPRAVVVPRRRGRVVTRSRRRPRSTSARGITTSTRPRARREAALALPRRRRAEQRPGVRGRDDLHRLRRRPDLGDRREDGARRWNNRSYSGQYFYATPTVAYGRVFVGNTDGTVYAFGATTGRLLWARHVGTYVYTAAAVWKRRVLVGTYDGTCSRSTRRPETRAGGSPRARGAWRPDRPRRARLLRQLRHLRLARLALREARPVPRRSRSTRARAATSGRSRTAATRRSSPTASASTWSARPVSTRSSSGRSAHRPRARGRRRGRRRARAGSDLQHPAQPEAGGRARPRARPRPATGPVSGSGRAGATRSPAPRPAARAAGTGSRRPARPGRRRASSPRARSR